MANTVEKVKIIHTSVTLFSFFDTSFAAPFTLFALLGISGSQFGLNFPESVGVNARITLSNSVSTRFTVVNQAFFTISSGRVQVILFGTSGASPRGGFFGLVITTGQTVGTTYFAFFFCVN